MTRRKELTFSILLIIISTVLFFLAAEILLRFFPVATGLRSVAVTVDNPVFHFTPNRDFVFSKEWNFEMLNRGHVNNAGFVNDQDYTTANQLPLLAIVGDSYIEAEMVPYSDTIQGRLAKALVSRAKVYSFAAAGAPLSQYLIWAQYAARKYNAKALVINVVGNDFDESLLAFNQGPGFWGYSPDADGTLHLKLVELHRGFIWSVIQRSALARYLFLNLQVNDLMYRFGWLRTLVMGRSSQTAETPKFAGNTEAEAGTTRVNASVSVINAFFRDLPQLTGLPPNRILFTMDGFRYPDEAKQGAGTYFDLMRQEFRNAAQQRGYEVIDLDSVFFPDFRKNGKRFEYLHDGHWNSYAHGLVASAITSSRLLQSFP